MKEERIVSQFLRSITILSHLSNNSFNRIQSCLIKKTFHKNEVIVEEGKTIDHIYLIYSGQFIIQKIIEVVFKIDEFQSVKERKKVGIVQISNPQFYGCDEILKQSASTFQLTACSEDCMAYMIPKQDFLQIAVGVDSDSIRVEKISTAWNLFLSDLLLKNQQQIINKKQFLIQNKLQMKEKQKNLQIQNTKTLERFLPDINLNTPKNKKISQYQDISSAKHTVNELLPSRIKNVKSMVNLQIKSDLYSDEFYENTNDRERSKLNQVHFDKNLVNFNLQNYSNIVYNKVEIFKYSKQDEEITEKPRAYKNDLLNKIEKIRKQNEEEQNSLTPTAQPKHENFFKSIKRRIDLLKNKHSNSPKSKQQQSLQIDSLRSFDYSTENIKCQTQISSPVNFPLSANQLYFSSELSTPKSVRSMTFKKQSNFNIMSQQPSFKQSKLQSPFSTPF